MSLPAQVQQRRVDVSESEYFLELIYPPDYTFDVLAATVGLTTKAQHLVDGFAFERSKDEGVGNMRRLRMYFRRIRAEEEFKILGKL